MHVMRRIVNRGSHWLGATREYTLIRSPASPGSGSPDSGDSALPSGTTATRPLSELVPSARTTHDDDPIGSTNVIAFRVRDHGRDLTTKLFVVTDFALRPEALVVARYWAPFKARLSTIWKCMSGAVRGGPSLDHSGVPAGGLGSYETGRMPAGLPTGLLPGALGST